MEPKILQIEDNLFLRSFAEADAPALFALTDANRARLREWLPWLDYNKAESDSADFIKSTHVDAENGSTYAFGIWFRNELAGVASLQSASVANRSISIGYWVGERFSKKGLAQKATRTLLRHGFEDLKFHRIEIRCATGNLKSQRIPESLGFKFEGIARDSEWLYEHFVDHRVYAMLSTEFSGT